mgnify:CR=1 FL=1
MNEFLTNEYTSVVKKLIKEVVNDPSTYMGSKYLPSVVMPVARVRTEIVEASGGMTQEHLPGTNTKYIERAGNRVQEFTPPFYKEAIHYTEKDILFWRELGQNMTNIRGVQQRIDIDMDRLNRRIEARIESQRWLSIFNGGFSWMGETVSFGIPGVNTAVPIGAAWSLDGVTANNAANPVMDLRYWVSGGLSYFRKYKITGIVMNPNTARWVLDNINTRTYVASYGANPAVGGYDINRVLKFLIPGLPDIVEYDGWYQDESVVNGKLVVSDANYFIPDGKIFFETALPGGDKIGEFVQTLNLATGSLAEPGAGKFLVVEDCTAPGSKGGPSNPYVDIIGGVYGGVSLDRPFDVLTATVYTPPVGP